MKKFITVLSLIVLFSGIDMAVAQIGIGIGTGGIGMGVSIPINNKRKAERRERIEEEVQYLKKELELNDDQLVKVRGLFIERERSRERNARKRMTRTQFDEGMQKILTEEQYQEYIQLRPSKPETKPEDIKEEKEQEKKKETGNPADWDDVYR